MSQIQLTNRIVLGGVRCRSHFPDGHHRIGKEIAFHKNPEPIHKIGTVGRFERHLIGLECPFGSSVLQLVLRDIAGGFGGFPGGGLDGFECRAEWRWGITSSVAVIRSAPAIKKW